MQQALDVVTTSKNTSMKIWLQGEVGLFRYQYVDDDDGAVKLLEQALKTLAGADAAVQKLERWGRDRYRHSLAKLLFDSAVSAQKNGTNAWPYTKRLKQLATVSSASSEDNEDAFDFFGPGYASMLWGCWLRTYEKSEETMWKKTFTARVLDEISMLDDEDPSNDMAGLHSLAITLLHLDEEEAAGSLLAVLFMPLKELRERAKAENDDDNDDDGSENIDEVQDSNAVDDDIKKEIGREVKHGTQDNEHDWEKNRGRGF
ncbi:MAG: hypothetical protein Q9222_002562 [Ikaeria aurantiellina]